MFKLSSVKDQAALEATRKALWELLAYAKLAGLMLLGDTIQIVEDASVATMATDGRSLFYAPSWVLTRSRDSNMADLLHEFLHIFGNHVGRRGSREKDRWNVAADVRVAHDQLTIFRRSKKNWKLEPDHIPAYPWAENLTVEQIYDRLPKEEKQIPEPKHDDLKEPKPGDKTQNSEEQFVAKFQENLAQAVAAIELSGQTLEQACGQVIADRAKQIMQGTIPWGRLLMGRMIGQLGSDRSTWLPPNRRYFPEVYLPSIKAAKEKHLVLGFDISTSIGPELYNKYKAEIAPALQRATLTTIVTFDSVNREVLTTSRPLEALNKMTFKGGAHSYTSARGVFEVADRIRPSAISIMTDGYVYLPERAYPTTHWVIPRGGQLQPWGFNYIMDFAW